MPNPSKLPRGIVLKPGDWLFGISPDIRDSIDAYWERKVKRCTYVSQKTGTIQMQSESGTTESWNLRVNQYVDRFLGTGTRKDGTHLHRGAQLKGHTKGNEFITYLSQHPKTQTAAARTGQGNSRVRLDKSDVANMARRQFGRTSKAAIEFVWKKTQGTIYYCLDGVNMLSVTGGAAPAANVDQLRSYGQGVTAREIRYIFRNRLELTGGANPRVRFYKDGDFVVPPWDDPAYKALWDGYEHRRQHRVGDQSAHAVWNADSVMAAPVPVPVPVPAPEPDADADAGADPGLGVIMLASVATTSGP